MAYNQLIYEFKLIAIKLSHGAAFSKKLFCTIDPALSATEMQAYRIWREYLFLCNAMIKRPHGQGVRVWRQKAVQLLAQLCSIAWSARPRMRQLTAASRDSGEITARLERARFCSEQTPHHWRGGSDLQTPESRGRRLFPEGSPGNQGSGSAGDWRSWMSDPNFQL